MATFHKKLRFKNLWQHWQFQNKTSSRLFICIINYKSCTNVRWSMDYHSHTFYIRFQSLTWNPSGTGDLLSYYIGSLLWICAALDARFESMNFKYMMREYLIWITERTPLIGTEFYELKTRLARLKVYMEFQIVLRADQTILYF